MGGGRQASGRQTGADHMIIVDLYHGTKYKPLSLERYLKCFQEYTIYFSTNFLFSIAKEADKSKKMQFGKMIF